MPVYEYECKCGEAFEVAFPTFSSVETPQCPACGSTRVRKLISRNISVYGDLDDFCNENNGKGRWNDQLGQHVKSVKHADSIAKKKGYVKVS